MFLVLLLLVLAGTANAYDLSINCPTTLQRGEPLVVNGTTNIPEGTSIEVLFSNTEFRTNEPLKQTVVIQGNGNKTFSVTFDTKDLSGGQYKVEVPAIAKYEFLGDSVTLREVDIIDRSGQIELSSPLTQYLDSPRGNLLSISGKDATLKGNGVRIEVTGPNGTVFGPAYIAIDANGIFSKDVTVEQEGIYNVIFSDNKGYIRLVNITVAGEQLISRVNTTPTPTESPPVTATAEASINHPAYFAVTTGTGSVKVSTSTGIDWVIEYIDRTGKDLKVNQAGKLDPETVTLEGDGGIMYIMVYPFSHKENGTVMLSVVNAEEIAASSSIPPVFANSTTVQTSVTAAQKSPLSLCIVLAAIGAVILITRKILR